jgi:hypothetical protein
MEVMRPGQIIGPIVLIVVGMAFLLNNLGWGIPVGYIFRTFWPLILIAVGIAQIAASLVGRGSLLGGVAVLTIGVLFSLQQIWGIRFSDTWPLLLIALGAIGLLRAIAGPAMFAGKSIRGGMRR